MKPPPTTTARIGGSHGLEAGVLLHPGEEARAPLDPLADLRGVGHGPHLEDAGQVDAGQRRADRRRAGGQHELVVGLGGHLTGREVAQLDGLVLRRDPDRLAARPAVDRELPAEQLARSRPADPTRARSRSRRGTADRSSRTTRTGPRSTIRISACSSSLRNRAAHDAPPATPPTMITFISRPHSD